MGRLEPVEKSSVKVRTFIRSNVVGFIALFVALGGSAAAIQANSVGPRELKTDSVREKHVKRNAIGSKHIERNAIRGKHVKRNQIGRRQLKVGALNALEGEQGPVGPQGETGPPGPVTGPAGGDLAGQYPNPVIAGGAVDADKVLNDSLGGADILESDLGQVPDAGSVDGLDGADLMRSAIYAVEQSVTLGGGFHTALSPNCEAGDLAIAGGWDFSLDTAGNIRVRDFKRRGTDEWLVNLSNLGASAQDITAYVYCIDQA